MKTTTKHLSIGFIPAMMVAVLRAENPKTLTTRMSGLAEVNVLPNKYYAPEEVAPGLWRLAHFVENGRFTLVKCRYKAGEIRRALTTWAVPKCLDDLKPSRVDFAGVAFWHAGMGDKPEWAGKNRPGNFLPGEQRHLMPEVEIVSVKLARMQAITEAEAVAEGATSREYPHEHVPGRIETGWSMDWKDVGTPSHLDGRILTVGEVCLHSARFAFANIIIRINGADAWDKNPWCWRVGLKLVSRGGAL